VTNSGLAGLQKEQGEGPEGRRRDQRGWGGKARRQGSKPMLSSMRMMVMVIKKNIKGAVVYVLCYEQRLLV